MFSAKFASKWNFMTRATIGDQVDAANRFSDTDGTHGFSMEEFIKHRYQVENIAYSDDYLTKKTTATASVFATKATSDE